MLQHKIQSDWLVMGLYMNTAMWLKIVYWHKNNTLAPKQTILKVYENMPNVPTLDFIKELQIIE